MFLAVLDYAAVVTEENLIACVSDLTTSAFLLSTFVTDTETTAALEATTVPLGMHTLHTYSKSRIIKVLV